MSMNENLLNYVGNPFKSPSTLSVCPGILGIERGFKKIGISLRVAAYVEIEAFIISNLVTAMEKGILGPAPIWTDLRTFDPAPFCGRLHAIIGGYPCPGESLAGLREKHKYSGFLWPDIRRIISATRPFWTFFENVDDHLTGTFPLVLRSLRNMGYRTEAGIFSAEELGATHERKRLFIFAVADSNSYGHRASPTDPSKESRKDEEKTQREEWHNLLREWLRDVIRDGCQEISQPMADTFSKGLEGFRNGEINAGEKIPLLAGLYSTQWPAAPGQQQHAWEEPRITKSGLGCSVNGYNFRADILRSLGNSVVETSAALAFLTLAVKFLYRL